MGENYTQIRVNFEKRFVIDGILLTVSVYMDIYSDNDDTMFTILLKQQTHHLPFSGTVPHIFYLNSAQNVQVVNCWSVYTAVAATGEMKAEFSILKSERVERNKLIVNSRQYKDMPRIGSRR